MLLDSRKGRVLRSAVTAFGVFPGKGIDHYSSP